MIERGRASNAPGWDTETVRAIEGNWTPVSAEVLSARVWRLGYAEEVLVVTEPAGLDPSVPRIRWKGRELGLRSVYEEPDERLRSSAPDRRTFLLECGDSVVRRIEGYRGGRGDLEHRALPVVDARLLVNLVYPMAEGSLLDPFAGAGGILLEARAKTSTVLSADSDPALRFGRGELLAAAGSVGLTCVVDTAINRKGTPVVVLVWRK